MEDQDLVAYEDLSLYIVPIALLVKEKCFRKGLYKAVVTKAQNTYCHLVNKWVILSTSIVFHCFRAW